MLLNTLIYHINKACDKNDLITARSFIEKDVNQLSASKNYNLLNANAKDLLAVVISEANKDGKLKFTREEQYVAMQLNKYSSNFDLPALQRMVRTYANTLEREGFQYLLNSDAKIIIESMGESILGMKMKTNEGSPTKQEGVH